MGLPHSHSEGCASPSVFCPHYPLPGSSRLPSSLCARMFVVGVGVLGPQIRGR